MNKISNHGFLFQIVFMKLCEFSTYVRKEWKETAEFAVYVNSKVTHSYGVS